MYLQARPKVLDKDSDTASPRLVHSREVDLPDGTGSVQSFQVFKYGGLRHEKPRKPLSVSLFPPRAH